MSEIVVGLKVTGEADVKALTEGLEKLGVKAEVVSSDKFQKLSKSSTALSKSIDGVVRSLDPAVNATARYERELALLKRGLELNKFDQDRYNQLLAASRQRYEEATSSTSKLTSALSQVGFQYLSLTSIIAGATAAMTYSTKAAMEAEQAAVRLETAVALKGDAYGITAGRLSEFASQLEQVTRFEDEAIQQAEAILLRFDSIDGSNIEQITRLTLDFATATGRDAASAATVLGKALEEPGESMRALKEVGATLTPQMQELVKHLMETGRTAEAQAILIERLSEKLRDLAERDANTAAGSVDKFKNALGNLAEAAGAPQLEALAHGADLLTAALTSVNPALGDSESALGMMLRKVLEVASPLNLLTGLINNLGDAWDRFRGKTAAPSGASGLDQYVADAAALTTQLEQADARIAAASRELEEIKKKKALEEQAEQAAKLKAEMDKVLASLEAFANAPIEKFDVPMPKPDLLTADGKSVPKQLADEYREYLDLLGQGETLETRINDLVNAGLITREQATAALNAQLDTTVKMVAETDELEAEWRAFQEKVEENFIRGVQTALADFFVAIFEGGDDAMKNFAENLKQLLFKTLAEYLAQWIITQAKMLAASLARIAKEKAAQQAANSAGGLSSGAWGAIAGIAAVAAAAAIAKYQKDKSDAQRYATDVTAGEYNGALYSDFRGRLTETGKQAADAIRDLMMGLQDATGVFIEGMKEISIRIRNDKKSFMVLVGGELVGYFTSLNEAVLAAVKESFLSADLSAELPKAIEEAIQNFRGSDPQELLDNVAKIRGVLDEISGLSNVEIELRDLPQRADALANSLRQMGVSLEESTRIANEWKLSQLNSLRDQITGHQQTEAERRAQFERDRAMFNAQLALYKIELETEIARLEGRQKAIETAGKLGQAELEIETTRLGNLGQVLQAEAELYDQEISIRSAYLANSATLVAAQGDVLQQQIDALKAILANLPAEISATEYRSGGGRGSGAGRVSSGPSKAERRDTIRDTLGDLASELLPALVAQSRDLTERLADLRSEMVALGMDTAELDALEAAHRDRLREQAQAEVGQYTQNPYEQQLAEILRWGAEMREVYTELGLSLEEVEAAEKARLETLGQEALAALGSPIAEAAAKAMQLQEAIAFLNANFEQLGLSAEDVSQAIQDAVDSWGLSILDNLLQYVDDEELRATLVQAKYEMEIAMLQAQFEILVEMGKLAPEVEAAIRKAFELLPTEAPTLGGGSGGGMGGFGDPINPHSVGGRDDSADKLRRSIDRLREFYESLYQNESLSPLSLADRYALAAQEYADTLAAAQAGDEAAIEALPDVATQYLELASQMFGTSTAAYQAIFEGVASDVQDLIGALEATDDWGLLHGQLNDFGGQFSSMIRFLDDIEANTAGGFGEPPPIGGSPETGAARAAATFRATTTERAIIYRGVPGLPSNVVVVQPQAAGGGDLARMDRLERSIDRLGVKLEKSLDKLAKSQTSAADLRARAAGNRR